MNTLLKLGASALAAGALLFPWTTAQAGTAEISSGDGATVSYEFSGDKVRMNLQGESSYMIVRDDNIYMVTDGGGGNMMVIDASQAWNMVGGMAGSTTPDMMSHEVISLEPTGRLEPQAGISGEVYILRSRSGNGKEQQGELVLTDDPRALEFRDAMHRMASTMARIMDKSQARGANDDMLKQLQGLGKGVLRYGNDMKVTALSLDPIEPARFVLPAAPTDLSSLSGLGAMLGGGQGAASGSGSQSGGSIWDSMRESMGGSAEEDSSETDEESAGAAAELGKALGRIFGN